MDSTNGTSIVKKETTLPATSKIELREFCSELNITGGDQLLALAMTMWDGGFADKAFDSPKKVMAAMLYGKVIGIHPLRAPMVLACINGKMSIWGAEVMSALLRSGMLEDYQAEDIKNKAGEFEGVVIRLKRKGIGGTFEGRWTLTESKAAGIMGNHQKYPRDHCHWKALARAAKHGFSDALGGVEIAEDISDRAERQNVRPIDTTAAEIVIQPDPLAGVETEEHPDDKKRESKPADDKFAEEMFVEMNKGKVTTNVN